MSIMGIYQSKFSSRRSNKKAERRQESSQESSSQVRHSIEKSDPGKEVPYPSPINEDEIKRLNGLQQLIKHYFEGNFSSPVQDVLEAGAKVLDIGCGSGAWMLEMAKEYPRSLFVGIDAQSLFLMNVSRNKPPPNVKFVQGNILDGLPAGDKEIDFVVFHYLTGNFSIKQWDSFMLKEVVRVLKPDGWLEWMEPDMQVKRTGPCQSKLMEACLAPFNTRGLSTLLLNEIPRLVASTDGLTLRSSTKRTIPFGKRGGKYGELNVKLTKQTYYSIKKLSMEFMSIHPEEYDELVEGFTREAEEYRSYAEYWRFCIQRVHKKQAPTL